MAAPSSSSSSAFARSPLKDARGSSAAQELISTQQLQGHERAASGAPVGGRSSNGSSGILGAQRPRVAGIGYAVRMFDRIQQDNVRWDCDKMWRQKELKAEMDERHKHGRRRNGEDSEIDSEDSDDYARARAEQQALKRRQLAKEGTRDRSGREDASSSSSFAHRQRVKFQEKPQRSKTVAVPEESPRRSKRYSSPTWRNEDIDSYDGRPPKNALSRKKKMRKQRNKKERESWDENTSHDDDAPVAVKRRSQPRRRNSRSRDRSTKRKRKNKERERHTAFRSSSSESQFSFSSASCSRARTRRRKDRQKSRSKKRRRHRSVSASSNSEFEHDARKRTSIKKQK
ncbi:unnamed protein product [Amoebophrya sp. A25]|nr:unnamed protein product [Amoebophrya sp. A25]|eukprot:GSA25T00009973001.1